MLSEISGRRRVKPPSEIYWPGDLLSYTLGGISQKHALLLGQCASSYGSSPAWGSHAKQAVRIWQKG
jgi:hypothetical protein